MLEECPGGCLTCWEVGSLYQDGPSKGDKILKGRWKPEILDKMDSQAKAAAKGGPESCVH